MRNVFVRLIKVHASYPDPAEAQQARRLLIINLGWLTLTLLAIPVLVWWQVESPKIDAGTLFVPATLILSIIIHRLIQQGELRRARQLFVLNILTASFLAIFPDYRIDTPFILVLTVPLTAAGVLLPRPGLFGIALVLVIMFTVGGMIQGAADMQATPFGSTAESIRTTILLVIGIIGLNTTMLWTFLGSIDDTLRQQHHLEEMIATTAQISETILALPSEEDALNRAIEQLRDALGLYHVQVFLADPASGLAALRASTGYSVRRSLGEDRLAAADENSPINIALRQKGPILIFDSSPEGRRVGFLPATRSELLLPLRVGTLMPIGVLDLHSTARDTFSRNVLDALVTVANHMAAALFGAQQTKELHAGYEERDRLLDQIEANQREVARLNRQLVGTTWGTYLEERSAAFPGFDWAEGSVMPSQAESDVLGQTLREGQPYFKQLDGTNVLCVPIRLRGQTLGALEFRRAGGVSWSPSALDLVQAVAERLALSLENARLFEQAQTTARREQLVSDVTSQLQSTSDLESLLTLAAARFQDALGATHTRVRLGLPPAGHPDHSA
jgi:GAF domain-containing protein